MTNKAQSHNHSHFKLSLLAIILGVSGWTAFSLSDVALKHTAAHFPIHFILLINGSVGLAITFTWLKLKYKQSIFHTPNLRYHLVRGFIVGINAIFIISALSKIPMADFYSIAFLTPLIITLVSAILMKEKLRLSRIIAIICGFGGVIVLVGPQFSDFNTGITFAFLVALCLSTGNLLARKIGSKDPLPLYALYPFLFIVIINLPAFLLTYDATADGPINFDVNFLYILTIPLMVMCGQIFISQAFSRAPAASIVAPFHYTQLIWGTLFGYFIFGDLPSATTYIGASIIVASGIYIIVSESKGKQSTHHVDIAINTSTSGKITAEEQS